MLVGDRFVRYGVVCWRDLATGDLATVRVHPLTEEWPILERTLVEECVAGRGPRPLVDFGLVGRRAWFEARASSPRAGEQTVDESVGRLADRLVTFAAGTERGVRLVRLPLVADVHRRDAASVMARRLRGLGFVTVRPSVPLDSRIAGDLAHRHVALVVCSDADRLHVTSWVRRLARASPRAHLIADFTDGRRVGRQAATVHERSNDDLPSDVPIGHWLAAPEPATPGSADTVTRARRSLLTLDFAAAESALAAAVAVAQSHRRQMAPDVTLALAELRFWQGRFDEAERLSSGIQDPVRLDASSPDGDELGANVLRGLTGWARGDLEGVRTSSRALIGRRTAWRSRATWAGALMALCAAMGRNESAVRHAVSRFTRSSAASRDDGPLLVRAVFAEALQAIGDHEAAERVLGRPARWGAAPPLYRVLAEWLAAQGRPAPAVTARVNRAGAHGVRRWGSRPMHLLHALPAMMQLVHDAEDEQAALATSCAWLRRHSDARGVAFLSSDGCVVTADGWSAAGADAVDLTEALSSTVPSVVSSRDGVIAVAPVRYAGRVIGAAAACGPVESATTLTEAVITLAALGAPALRARLDTLAAARDSQTSMPEIVGRSPAMAALRQAIARAATAPFPILVEGESGTGKELVARAVHRLSPRRDRRFSAVNCAALGDDLIEAELFGHSRGAFTGAVGPRTGLFEDAHGGTLMLDEVAELSARAQAKLLRVLQEREVRRLGENAARPVDVRVVAATNRPLGDLAGRGLFRADLLFRLAVIRLRLPPLRERVEDVPLLVHEFWRDLTRQAGKRALLGPDAVAALCRHDWPGNVRELQNVVAALVVEAPNRGRTSARVVAKVLDVSGAERQPEAVPLEHARAACERQTVASALTRHAGRRAAAARELGLTRQGLAKAMKRLGLSVPGDHAGVA